MHCLRDPHAFGFEGDHSKAVPTSPTAVGGHEPRRWGTPNVRNAHPLEGVHIRAHLLSPRLPKLKGLDSIRNQPVHVDLSHPRHRPHSNIIFELPLNALRGHQVLLGSCGRFGVTGINMLKANLYRRIVADISWCTTNWRAPNCITTCIFHGARYVRSRQRLQCVLMNVRKTKRLNSESNVVSELRRQTPFASPRLTSPKVGWRPSPQFTHSLKVHSH